MKSNPANISKEDILIVDDTPNNLRLLSTMLAEEGYEVRKALNGRMALISVQAEPPDLILLDIKMPEMNGYEVCQQLKVNEKISHVPVIFISALDDVADKVKAFEVGGADYITKPFQEAEVLARVKNQLSIQKLQRQLREQNELLQQQILNRKLAEEQIIRHALYDSLTNLPNRALFLHKLQAALDKSLNHQDKLFAVLFIDLDHFKMVNDSLGHLVGDQLLRHFSQQLRGCIESHDTLARLGGDEFAILLENISSVEDCTAVAKRIQKQFKLPFRLKEQEFFVSASIGIALCPNQATGMLYENVSDLLRDADIAMYRAKNKGKAGYAIFDSKMYINILNRLKLETNLRQAIERSELTLYYQPIIALGTGNIAGFEALARWQHSETKWVSPKQFIPVAEETGLIVPLGAWVMREAARQMQEWQLQGWLDKDATVSVNVAGKQFAQANFVEQVETILREEGLPGRNFRIEVTESAIVANVDSVVAKLRQIKKLGVQVSIDDFGTGYSSLSRLQTFPIDILKIDRSFVCQMDHSEKNREFVRAIIDFAHSLDLKVIAEGIETPEQKTPLQVLGCEYGQGYLFSQPMKGDFFATLIADGEYGIGFE